MISVAEARTIIFDHVRRMPAEEVSLLQALGRTLAEPVTATRAQPPFAASAMDGYALRSVDTPGELRVIGEAGAGHALTQRLGGGECARIFTGAPLPEGADAILVQEQAHRSGDIISAPYVELGRHVRSVGIDFAAGAVLLDAPRILDGPALAVAAAAGRAHLWVARRPYIVILSGGDEIVSPSAVPGPAQIFDSASYGIVGLAGMWGSAPRAMSPFVDNVNSIAAGLQDALEVSDLVVVVGGASVGDHDHARAAMDVIGARVLFDKVAIRPGKPTWFAIRGDKTILGLPGNPTSALVCARLFLRPVIDQMLGRDPRKSCETQSARLRTPLETNGPRETYLRALTDVDENGQTWVRSFENQDSSLVTIFAAANALIPRVPRQPAGAWGDIVPVLPI